MAGDRLGPYEILSPLGRGGMGEVYRAKDPRLDRDVAIKVLPEALARDPERVARFQREAKLLASLNHANIAGIYGFEEAEGKRFLVLEYVEGQTLAARLKNGPVAIDDALEIAKQIAAGLEAAHEKGVIHRDLKPGNVMLTSDGTVKVLDFGLAKAMADEPSDSTLANSPTITANYTKPGVVLGTAAYMSPEQARGRAVDKRTDVWSFGCVLFEMLTGTTAFAGETVTDSIGAILHREPDWFRLPESTPPTVQLALRRCLAKDRQRRLQAIGDARLELEEVHTTASWLGAETGPDRSNRLVGVALPWVICAALAAMLVVVVARNRVGPPVPIVRPVRRSVLTLPPNTGINWRSTNDTWSKIGFSELLAVSPDGRRIIVTLQEGEHTSLYLKDHDEFLAHKVAGADGARGPFFSPDGLWVGFLTESVLQKVRLPGGAAQPICETDSAAFDATWLDDGTIVYSTDLGLRRVAASGGTSRPLTSIDVDAGIRGHHFPHAILGTSLVIFTVTTDEGQHAALLSLDDSTWRVLKKHATDARYVASGHLVFARGGELFASSYDPSDPTAVGVEVPIVRGVHVVPGLGGAVVHLFATSDAGMLAYAPRVDPPDPDALVWVDHAGNEEEIVHESGHWMHQRLSPDGEHILFNRLTSDGMLDLYIYDMQRDQINPLTRRGNAYDAEWSPDGRTVGFAALDTRGRAVYLIPADFSGPARKIMDGLESRPHFSQWSRDGSTLVFFDRSKQGGIWTTSPESGDAMKELMNSPLGEAWARISPDGTLITFVGFEPGRRDVYVQEYPDLGPRIRVSKNGGGEPRWASDSRTLYFREAGRIFKATIVTKPRLDVTTVEQLPINDVYDAAASGHQHYDLSVDGTKFLMVKHGRRSYPTSVHILENWTAARGEESAP